MNSSIARNLWQSRNYDLQRELQRCARMPLGWRGCEGGGGGGLQRPQPPLFRPLLLLMLVLCLKWDTFLIFVWVCTAFCTRKKHPPPLDFNVNNDNHVLRIDLRFKGRHRGWASHLHTTFPIPPACCIALRVNRVPSATITDLSQKVWYTTYLHYITLLLCGLH